MGPHPTAAEIERLAAAAWPAEVRRRLGPWTLRADHGVTSRANSVFAVPVDDARRDADVANLIPEVEAFYAAQGLPPTFHISPAAFPSGLDGQLAAQGYVIEKPSQVWVAPLTSASAGADPGHDDHQVVCSPAPDNEWLDTALGSRGPDRVVMERIIRRVTADQCFAAVRADDGSVVSCGSAVLDGGWIGIYSMNTRPAARGRGRATRVLAALLEWGRARGATRAYLQVVADNTVAHRLYARAGFWYAYPYHYRVKRKDDV